MKGEMDAYGRLRIWRVDRPKDQYCPHKSESESRVPCGDWCPMFREPKVWAGGASLDICNNTLYFDEFEDKR